MCRLSVYSVLADTKFEVYHLLVELSATRKKWTVDRWITEKGTKHIAYCNNENPVPLPIRPHAIICGEVRERDAPSKRKERVMLIRV